MKVAQHFVTAPAPKQANDVGVNVRRGVPWLQLREVSVQEYLKGGSQLMVR
jgi:hypothetical protein